MSLTIQKKIELEIEDFLNEKVAQNQSQPLEKEGLLQFLIEIQEKYRYVSKQSIPSIAKSFNISKAEVYGVITFYDDLILSDTPPDQDNITIKVCKAEACQSMGGRMLEKTLLEIYKKEIEQGRITIQSVYCLGNCALAPSVMIKERCIGLADVDKIKQAT